MHGAVGAVGIVGGVGRLGQDVESCPESRPFIGTQIADVTDAAVAQQFRQQQGQKGVQGRNGFRTGQARLTHRVGKIQSEQLWDEQKQARDLGGELPIGGQGPLLHVGHGGHQRTIAGVLARLRLGSAALPLGGHARVVQQAKEIAFADPMAFCLQLAANGFQGLPLAAQLAGTVADGVAFGRRPVAGWGSAEKLVEVGVLGEVAH